MWGEWKTGRAQIQTSSKVPKLFHMISTAKKIFSTIKPQFTHNFSMKGAKQGGAGDRGGSGFPKAL